MRGGIVLVHVGGGDASLQWWWLVGANVCYVLFSPMTVAALSQGSPQCSQLTQFWKEPESPVYSVADSGSMNPG